MNCPKETEKRSTTSVSARERRNNPKTKRVVLQVSIVNTKTALASQKKALKTAKRQTAALRRKVKQGSVSDDTSNSDPEDDAVNSFDGHEEKDRN